MADGGLERIREMLGADALSDLSALDLSIDLEVDRAAAALLNRFRGEDDAAAFGLLVELTSERLAAIAQDIATELGMGTSSYELVTNFFSRMFVDLSPRESAPLQFLASAAEKLKKDAETIIRDLALGEVPDPEEPILWQDSSQQERQDHTEAMVAQAARIGFHRLDLNYRKVLRAKNISGLSTSDIATQQGTSYAEMEALLQTAQERLARAIDDVLKGPSS